MARATDHGRVRRRVRHPVRRLQRRHGVRIGAHQAGRPLLREGRGDRAHARGGGIPDHHGWRPRNHGSREPRGAGGKRPVHRLQYRAAVRTGAQSLRRARDQLPLLFRPQDDVRQVLDRFHRLPRRVRDDGRAVRGAHVDSDREGEALPCDPVRRGVLDRPRGVAAGACGGGGQNRHHRSPAVDGHGQPAGGRGDRTAGAGAPQPGASSRGATRRGGAMTTRKDFLQGQRIDPKPITGRETVSELVDNAFLAYNAGRLAEGCRLFTALMLEEDVTVGMSLTGAMTPAGLGMSTIIPLLEAGFIDWVVSTGANLYHDAHFGLGLTMHRGSPFADDVELREEGVVRIYDIFFDYEVLLSTDAKTHGGKSGILIIGGGSPKNFVLQTEPQIQEVLGISEKGHDYYLQMTDARADTGGLSGATPAEAVSWGKVDPDKLPGTVVCYLDNTVGFPILAAYALAKRKKRRLKRLYERREEMMRQLTEAYQEAKADRDARAEGTTVGRRP